jgi:hypothetical protein
MRFQLKREWVIPTVVGVVSFGTGVVTGYILNERRYKGYLKVTKERTEELESEHAQRGFEFDDRIGQFNKALAQANFVLDKLKEDGREYLDRYDPAELMEARHSHPANGENVVNIFPKVHGDDEDWNYEQEVAQRTPDKPYIIHRDEYYDNENDDRQSTLTYYEGDNILCDSHDTPVYDVENVVGFLRFGHGSQDPNICYVRNERLMAEYEVLRDGGYYQVEVLGEALEEKDIKHSKQLPKFRLE